MAIEKTVSEIAEILGVSRQAVNNRVKALAPEDTQKKRKRGYCCNPQWLDQARRNLQKNHF